MIVLSFFMMVFAIGLFAFQIYRMYRSSFSLLIPLYGVFLFIIPGIQRISDHTTYLGELSFPEDIIYQNIVIAIFFAALSVSCQIMAKASLHYSQATLRVFFRHNKNVLKYSFAIMLVMSFVANSILYENALYPFFISDINRFSVMMLNAKGSWYLVILSQLAVFPCIMLLGNLWNGGILRFGIGVALLLVTFVVTAPPTRTGFVAAIVAYALLRFDGARSKQAKAMAVAISLILAMPTIALLGYLNENRLGSENATRLRDASDTSITETLLQNFYQYDNGLILNREWQNRESTKFSFYLASISPVNLMPSAILPFEKPRADKEAFMTEVLFGTGLNLTYYSEGSTITYAIPMTGTTDYGTIGTIVAALTYCLIMCFIMNCNALSPPDLKLFWIYLVVIFVATLRLSIESAIQQAQVIALALIFIKMVSVFVPDRQPAIQCRPS